MAALHAVVKSLGPQRHLGDRDAESPAQPVKVGLGERAFVPGEPETSYFFGEELHNLGAAKLYDRCNTISYAVQRRQKNLVTLAAACGRAPCVRRARRRVFRPARNFPSPEKIPPRNPADI